MSSLFDLVNSLNAITNMNISNYSKSVPQIIQEIEDKLKEAQTLVAKFKDGEINSKTVDKFVDNLENVLDIVDDLGDELENRYPNDSDSDNSDDMKISSDDDGDDVASVKSDVTFTEEERSYIENEKHYAFLKKFGLRPTARKNFANCYKSEEDDAVI
jgi:hypothetical protein